MLKHEHFVVGPMAPKAQWVWWLILFSISNLSPNNQKTFVQRETKGMAGFACVSSKYTHWTCGERDSGNEIDKSICT